MCIYLYNVYMIGVEKMQKKFEENVYVYQMEYGMVRENVSSGWNSYSKPLSPRDTSVQMDYMIGELSPELESMDFGF